MTTILVLLTIIFYLLGMIFFVLLAGMDLSKTKDVFLTIFYPVTMWFIK